MNQLINALFNAYSDAKEQINRGQNQLAQKSLNSLKNTITGLAGSSLSTDEQEKSYLLTKHIIKLCESDETKDLNIVELQQACLAWQHTFDHHAELHYRLGRLAATSNQYENAQHHYKTALQIYCQQAQDAYEKKDIKQAAAHYETMLHTLSEFLAPPHLTQSNIDWANDLTASFLALSHHDFKTSQQTLGGLFSLIQDFMDNKEVFSTSRELFKKSAAKASRNFYNFVSHLLKIQSTPPSIYQSTLYAEALISLYHAMDERYVTIEQCWNMVKKLQQEGDLLRATVHREIACRLVSSFQNLLVDDKHQFMTEYVEWLKTSPKYENIEQRWLLLPESFRATITDIAFLQPPKANSEVIKKTKPEPIIQSVKQSTPPDEKSRVYHKLSEWIMRINQAIAQHHEPHASHITEFSHLTLIELESTIEQLFKQCLKKPTFPDIMPWLEAVNGLLENEGFDCTSISEQIAQTHLLRKQAAREQLTHICDVRLNPLSSIESLDNALIACNQLIHYLEQKNPSLAATIATDDTNQEALNSANFLAKVFLLRGNLLRILVQKKHEFKTKPADFSSLSNEINGLYGKAALDLEQAKNYQPDDSIKSEILASIALILSSIGQIYSAQKINHYAEFGGKTLKIDDICEQFMNKSNNEALQYIEQALKIDPMNMDLLWQAALLQINVNQPKEAITTLNTIIAAPNGTRKHYAQFNAAILRSLLKDHQGLKNTYQELRSKLNTNQMMNNGNPSLVALYFLEAQINLQEGCFNEALKCFIQAKNLISSSFCNDVFALPIFIVFPPNKMSNKKIRAALDETETINDCTTPMIIKKGNRFIFYKTVQDLTESDGVELDDIHQMLNQAGIIITPGLVVNLKNLSRELHWHIQEKIGVHQRVETWDRLIQNSIQTQIDILTKSETLNTNLNNTDMLNALRILSASEDISPQEFKDAIVECTRRLSQHEEHKALFLTERGRLKLAYIQQNYKIQNIHGKLNLDAKLYAEAIADFEASLHIHPTQSTASFLIGYAYFLRGRLFQAAQENSPSLKTDEHSEQRQYFMKIEREAYAKSQPYFERILGPDLNDLAESDIELEELDIELDDRDSTDIELEDLDVVLEKIGISNDEHTAAATTTLEIKPEHIDSHWHLAETHFALNQYEQAIKHYTILTHTDSEKAIYAYLKIAEIASIMGQKNGASNTQSQIESHPIQTLSTYHSLLTNQHLRVLNAKYQVHTETYLYYQAATYAFQNNDINQAIELLTKAKESISQSTCHDFLRLPTLFAVTDQPPQQFIERLNKQLAGNTLGEYPLLLKTHDNGYSFFDNINSKISINGVNLGKIHKLVTDEGIACQATEGMSVLSAYYPRLYRYISRCYALKSLRIQAWDNNASNIIDKELNRLTQNLPKPIDTKLNRQLSIIRSIRQNEAANTANIISAIKSCTTLLNSDTADSTATLYFEKAMLGIQLVFRQNKWINSHDDVTLWGDAHTDLIAAYTKNPSSFDTVFELGKLYKRTGYFIFKKYEQTREEWIKKYPNEPLEIHCRAFYIEAKNYFIQALQLKSQDPETLWALAQTHEDLNELESATTIYQQLTLIMPHAKIKLAELAAKSGQFAQAEQAYLQLLTDEQFIAKNQDNQVCSRFFLYYQAAKMARKTGATDRANTFYQQALDAYHVKPCYDFDGIEIILMRHKNLEITQAAIHLAFPKTKTRNILLVRELAEGQFIVTHQEKGKLSTVTLGDLRPLLSEIGIFTDEKTSITIQGNHPKFYRLIKKKMETATHVVSAWDLSIKIEIERVIKSAIVPKTATNQNRLHSPSSLSEEPSPLSIAFGNR